MIKLLVALILFLIIPQESIKDEAEKSIAAFFSKNISLEFEKVTIPMEMKLKIEAAAQQKFFKDFVFRWKVFDDDRLIGYAFMDNVYGKTMPITFMVIVDTKGEIINSEILKYREPYGGAVAERGWLNQFNKKNSKSTLKNGDDISTITGATISSKAVTTGIKKILLLNNMIDK